MKIEQVTPNLWKLTAAFGGSKVGSRYLSTEQIVNKFTQTDEDDLPLSFCSEQQIFEELNKRHNSYLYVYETEGAKQGALCNALWFQGSPATLIGLAAFASIRLEQSLNDSDER